MRKIESGSSGLRAALLVDHEGGQQRERAGELADRARGAPADVGRLDERVDEQQHPAGGEDRSADVEVRRARARGAVGGEQPEVADQHEHARRAG